MDILENMKKRNATYEEFIEMGRQDQYYATHISSYITFQEPEMREFWDSALHLYELTNNEYFSLDFVREFQNQINWNLMFRKTNFDHRILFEFWDKIEWDTIIYSHQLNEEEHEFYLNKAIPQYNKDYYIIILIQHQQLSEQFLEKHLDEFKKYFNYIWHFQKLSEKFIEKHLDIIDWDTISAFQDLSEKFMDKYESKINWDQVHLHKELSKHYVMKIYNEFMNNKHYTWLYKYSKITEYFIRRYWERFKWDWDEIIPVVPLSEDFIEYYGDEIDRWDLIAESQNISEDFVERVLMKKKNFDLSAYLMHSPVSEKFLRRHWNKIGKRDKNNLVLTQNLSESFLREFKDEIDLSACTYVGKKDINFLREFKDNMSFSNNFFRQKLNKKEIEEFKDRLDWDWVSQSLPLNEKMILKYSEKITWAHLDRYQNLSKKFIEKY